MWNYVRAQRYFLLEISYLNAMTDFPHQENNYLYDPVSEYTSDFVACATVFHTDRQHMTPL